jgi:chromosomal replication initiator protein
VLKTTLRHYLERVYTNRDLDFWFDPLELREDPHNNTILVSFPHALFGQWFMHTVRRNFEICANSFLQARLVYDYPPRFPDHAPESSANGEEKKPESNNPDKIPESGNGFFQPCAGHTFSTFLVNKKNDFPLAAAKKAALQADNPPHSPLILYGPSGSGKTHLLGAMANAVKNEFQNIPIYYGCMDSIGWIQPHDSAQTVFLDDLQRITHFSGLQDSFALLLDRLGNGKGLVVCVFDSHPASCPEILPKLLSRLSSGLVLELKKPDLDIRRRYIHAKNEQSDMGINKDQELLIAQRFQDIRSIDGVLARITAYRSTINKNADIGVILEKATEEKILTPADIITVIARHYDLSPKELTQKSRNRTLTLPRQISIYLVRELLGLSLIRLGNIFGGRDHSSILYSIKKIEDLRKRNKDVHKTLTDLKHLCLAKA